MHDGQAFDPEAAARAVTGALRPLGTPERAQQEKRYLKSDLEFLGVTVPDMRRVVRAAARDYPGLSREASVAWAVALWRAPVHEPRMAAVEVLGLAVPRLAAADLALVAELIREARTWALADGLACNVAGGIALRDPASWRLIDPWAGDGDFWIRRSALLALLPGIRSGAPDLARFTRYAEPMLNDKEFFIRKAIGWVLREIARRDPGFTAGWTRDHISEMSGVTFREAVRRLPAGEADRLLSLRSARSSRGRAAAYGACSRPVALSPVPIIPDTKDWTWVLRRPCPDCGLDTTSFARESIPGMILANAAAWRPVLTSPGVTRRPRPDKWSPLEYACHVRDVFRLYDYRLGLMLRQDDPLFPNWDQDETAVADRYAEQDPSAVGPQLTDAAAALADRFASVTGGQWLRTGRRSDGAEFTVETFGRYFIHDPVHHLYDVTGARVTS